MELPNRKSAPPHSKSEEPSRPGQSGSGQKEESGLTLEEYARAKALPIDFLKSLGVTHATIGNKPALRIPYYGAQGEEVSVRLRLALEGDRFRWETGTKICLYGQQRLADARRAGYVVLVEGESDCHTLWSHGIPALGIPGAGNWREERDAGYLDGIETIYVIIEPDRGGQAVRKWLAQSKDSRSRETDSSADQRSIGIVSG